MAKQFTATEVGTLIENLRSEFRVVGEGVASLHNIVLALQEDMHEVKDRLTSLENRVTSLEDVIRLAVPDLSRRVTRIETKLGL